MDGVAPFYDHAFVVRQIFRSDETSRSFEKRPGDSSFFDLREFGCGKGDGFQFSTFNEDFMLRGISGRMPVVSTVFASLKT